MNAQATWTPLNSGTTANLRDIYFISADTGFAVGDDSTVLFTTNRGSNWTILPPFINGNVAGIYMADEYSGYAVGEYMSSIPKTTNGGNSWFASPNNGVGNPCFPTGLFFDGPNEGYLYGKGCFGGAYISVFDGNAWSQEHMLYFGMNSNFEYVQIEGIAKDPANSVYVAVCNYGKIFRSTNGFQNWDTIAYPDTTDFTAVDYAGNNTFYASSSQILNSVYISTDGGQTFAYDASYNPTFYYSGFYDIDMLTNGFGVVAGFSQTTGGGFIQMRSPSQGWMGANSYFPVDHILRSVYVVDSTLAYAAGDSGAIYRYDLTTGIANENKQNETIAVFPSVIHATETFTVDFSANENWSLEILDVNGKQIAVYPSLQGKTELNSFTQNSGMYFLKASGLNSGKTACKKIIIQ